MCVALGTYYTIGLTATHVQYGLSIGVLAGVLSFIPYVGTAFAWICSLALAAVQFDELQPVMIVLGMLYVGHLLEAYVLAPRLVGHRVGLHPVWIFFALLAGAKLMGFTRPIDCCTNGCRDWCSTAFRRTPVSQQHAVQRCAFVNRRCNEANTAPAAP